MTGAPSNITGVAANVAQGGCAGAAVGGDDPKKSGSGGGGGGGRASSCLVEVVLQWGPNEVAQWLESVGLPMYCHAFKEHEISGTELLSLERRDFKDVGVKKVNCMSSSA